MKTTRNPPFIPSGTLPVDEFIKQVCAKNDLNTSYLIIRSKAPVTFKQIKIAYQIVNN